MYIHTVFLGSVNLTQICPQWNASIHPEKEEEVTARASGFFFFFVLTIKCRRESLLGRTQGRHAGSWHGGRFGGAILSNPITRHIRILPCLHLTRSCDTHCSIRNPFFLAGMTAPTPSCLFVYVKLFNTIPSQVVAYSKRRKQEKCRNAHIRVR